jgi:hypothetical protein
MDIERGNCVKRILEVLAARHLLFFSVGTLSLALNAISDKGGTLFAEPWR